MSLLCQLSFRMHRATTLSTSISGWLSGLVDCLQGGVEEFGIPHGVSWIWRTIQDDIQHPSMVEWWQKYRYLSYGACKTKYRLHSVRKPRENMWYSTADDVAITVCFPRLFSSLLAPECLVVCVGAYDLIFIHKTSQLSLALNCRQLMWPTYLKISPLQWFRVILIYIIAQFPSLAVPWAGVRQMACESKISWNKYDLLSEI